MKRNNTNQNASNASNAEGGTTLKDTCLTSCRKILGRIAVAREMIFNESRQILKVHEHLLRLALNEAEAAAWQTMYPHLVFPTLATEKVQAVIAWDTKRQALQQARPAF